MEEPDAPPRPDADPGQEGWAPAAHRTRSRGTSGFAGSEAGAVHGSGWAAAPGEDSLQQHQTPGSGERYSYEPYQHAMEENQRGERAGEHGLFEQADAAQAGLHSRLSEQDEQEEDLLYKRTRALGAPDMVHMQAETAKYEQSPAPMRWPMTKQSAQLQPKSASAKQTTQQRPKAEPELEPQPPTEKEILEMQMAASDREHDEEGAEEEGAEVGAEETGAAAAAAAAAAAPPESDAASDQSPGAATTRASA